jgi:hypothetical protein
MTDEQIKQMVDRFLGWKLPADFRPDGGIEFDADSAKKRNPRNLRHEPRGTNVLDAVQAEGMVRYMVEGMRYDLDAAQAGWLRASELHRIAVERAEDAEARVERLRAALDWALNAAEFLRSTLPISAVTTAVDASIARCKAALAEQPEGLE